MLNKILFSFCFLVISTGHSAVKNNKQLKYRTFFGSCPSKTAGAFTMKVVQAFDNGASFKDIKEMIVKEEYKEKFFIDDYRISYKPESHFLKFNFDCPAPLLKAQVYKSNGLESYSAILVENGKLFDPTYEVILRSENKLPSRLPSLALPIAEIGSSNQLEIAEIFSQANPAFQKKVSEIILSDEGNLTVILSINNRPSSAFVGNGNWKEKFKKLERITRFMIDKKKHPTVINLSNHKKVVVKFSENL